MAEGNEGEQRACAEDHGPGEPLARECGEQREERQPQTDGEGEEAHVEHPLAGCCCGEEAEPGAVWLHLPREQEATHRPERHDATEDRGGGSLPAEARFKDAEEREEAECGEGMTRLDKVEIAAASIGGVPEQPGGEDVVWAVVGGQVVGTGEGGDGADDEVDGDGRQQEPREAADRARWWRRPSGGFRRAV